MASQINASNSGFGGIVSTGDSSGQLALQAAGTTVANITSTGMAVTGTLSASGVTTFAAGTAALPAITTTGDTNTGIFFPAADTIAFTEGGTESMRIDSSGNLLVGPSATGTYPYNAVNTVNYKRQLTSGSAQAVFTFTKTNTTVSSSFRNSFMGNLYVAFSGRTSGGTTSSYGFNVLVNIASNAGNTITMASSSVTSLNGASSGLTVSCAVSLTSASATSATLSVTITQTAGTLQDNELTAYLTGANSATDSTNFFTVTPA